MILLRLDAGATPACIAQELQVARSTISRVRSRFLAEGLAGLRDHREHNGQRKVSAAHRRRLEQLLDASPRDFGWARPTWTRELLALQLARDTGLHLSVGHIGRLLRALGARRKRPRPVVRCPWPMSRERRRIGAIHKLIRSLPRDEIAFYADEMDVDLNPRLGLDWMRRGRQKRVRTPGNNQKRYVAGARTIGSGKLTWAFGARKSSDLFIAALAALLRRCRRYRRLHVIVDNFGIHTSKRTRAFVEAREASSCCTSCRRTRPSTTASNESGSRSTTMSPATIDARASTNSSRRWMIAWRRSRRTRGRPRV
ncbi:IS630 family transposase [Sorangium sp. So ce233]